MPDPSLLDGVDDIPWPGLRRTFGGRLARLPQAHLARPGLARWAL